MNSVRQSLFKHYEHRLGAPSATLSDRVGHLIVTPVRSQLDELQCMRPFWALATRDAFILSVSPLIVDDLPLMLSTFTFQSLIEEELMGRVRAAIERRIALRSFAIESELFVSFEAFQPADTGDVRPVSFDEIDPHESVRPILERVLDIPLRDGDVFGVFRDGRVVSCAWIKRFSVYAWNVAVLGLGRGRGAEFDAQALSKVIRRALEAGKVAVMNVPEASVAALRLARRLGFRRFAQSLVAVSKPIRAENAAG